MIKHLFTTLIFVLSVSVYSQAFTENFDNITTLTGSGWYQQNNSAPIGTNPMWFQGSPPSGGGPFIAYNGAENSYIACNFNSTATGTGTISNWLVTPNRTLRNGDVLTFYTRKPTIGSGQVDYPDRLEVRLSTNGASTNVGTGASGVGDFTTLLLSINPTLTTNVYPQVWTQYTITISGLSAPTSGRFAFRYFVTNAGPIGTNSDYIGLDNVVYTPYVCPAFTMTAGGALTGGVAGSAYSYTLTQTGALGAPNFAITSGALPPGLTLAANGTISGTPTATGTFNFTATVNDASGCSSSQSYSITVTCPSNPISITNSPEICSDEDSYLLTEASPAGGTYSGVGVSNGYFTPSSGTQTITYDYTDPYGCSHSEQYTITVNAAPVLDVTGGSLANGTIAAFYSTYFTQTGGTGTPEFSITAGSLPTGITLTSAGNLSGTPSVYGTFNFTVSVVGDGNSCSDSKAYTLIIDNCELPNTPIPDFIGQCSVNLSDLNIPTLNDECGNPITPTTNASFPITSQGTTVITWSYEEKSGNIVTKNQNLVIEDTIAPVPTVANLPTITAECIVNAEDVSLPSATDNCNGAVTVSHNGNFPITTQGTTVITWTYEDANGNTSTQTQNILIEDTIAPVPTVANLPTITAECIVNAEDVSLPSATDNCNGAVTVSHNGNFPITTQGTTVITWTYEDANGNTSTQTQNILIEDTIAPVPTVANLPTITAECIVNAEDVSLPSATDNCNGAVTVSHNGNFPITTQGTTVITWTYEDANGNTSTQTQNILIQDTIAPSVNIQNFSLELEGEGNAAIDPAMFDDWVSDNCGIESIVVSQLDFDCGDLGENILTITVTDVNGNQTQENFTVTINDPDNLCEELSIIDTTQAEFTIYPNPARHKVYLRPSSNISIQKVSVVSLSGQRIQQFLFNDLKNEYEINVNYLDAGTYILQIESSAGIFTKKLLVKR